MINFYFHRRYFHIQYNYYSRNHSFRFIIIFLFFKKCPHISNYSIFNWSIINFFSLISFFFSFSSSVSKSFQISLIILSLIYFFYFFSKKILLMFCVSGLLSFFSLLYALCLGVFVLKRLTILSLKLPTLLL